MNLTMKHAIKSEIVFIPYEEAYDTDFEDMLRRVPSIDKVQRHIGFSPNADLDSILENNIKFIKGQLEDYGQHEDTRISKTGIR